MAIARDCQPSMVNQRAMDASVMTESTSAERIEALSSIRARHSFMSFVLLPPSQAHPDNDDTAHKAEGDQKPSGSARTDSNRPG